MGEMNGAMKDAPQASIWWKIKTACRLFFSDEVWDEITAEEEEKDRHLFPGHTASQDQQKQEP
jgi:hypothetical protein